LTRVCLWLGQIAFAVGELRKDKVLVGEVALLRGNIEIGFGQELWLL